MHGHSTCRGSGFAFSTAGDFRDQELMAWYKDPLLFFLLVGAVIFAFSQWASQKDG